MSNLDKKLKQVLANLYVDGLEAADPPSRRRHLGSIADPISHAEDEIKQAYIDAGWYHSPLVDHQMKRIESGDLMTKEEWERQAVKDGWVKGDQAKVLQELMNLKVNTEAAIHRLGMSKVVGREQEIGELHGVRVVIDPDLMTGQEWDRRFSGALGKPTYMNDEDGRHAVYKIEWIAEAAQKASELNK